MPAPDFSEPPAPGAAAFPPPPESAQSPREPQLPRAGFLPQSGPLPQAGRRPAAAPLPQEAEIPVRAPAGQASPTAQTGRGKGVIVPPIPASASAHATTAAPVPPSSVAPVLSPPAVVPGPPVVRSRAVVPPSAVPVTASAPATAPPTPTVPATPTVPVTAFAPETPAAPEAPEPSQDIEDTASAPAEARPRARRHPPRSAKPAAPPATSPPQAPAQSHVRVDARLLEAALLNLRKRIAAIPLVFEIAGSAEVKTERNKLLSQIDDYLLPRVRRSAAPVLVALVGSTGAGKSTLVNSIVGTRVSATGVRRPTTNSPVLACHPDDIDWFAENNFLPTLPRVRQEGLARPGRDGLLVLAASEGMPRGIALLDTPDIDSVVQAHHEFAYQFLDASDLWLFMTSASRYADGPVWEILQHARDRKASLGVVLSRVPQTYRTELVEHFTAMLDANGIGAEDRFVILETPLIDGMLPPDAYQPVRDWLADTAARADRRVAVLSQTMSGVLDTFKSRVPAIAAHVEAQVVLRGRLRRAAEVAYERAFAEASTGMKNGSLLHGEVLARWQDCEVGGDLRPRRGAKAAAAGARKGKRARRGTSRPAALNAALRSALESFIVSIADRAAEHVDENWRGNPAGTVLLADAVAERARGERAKQVFEAAFGPAGTGTRRARRTPARPPRSAGPDLTCRCAPRARSEPGRSTWPGWSRWRICAPRPGASASATRCSACSSWSPCWVRTRPPPRKARPPRRRTPRAYTEPRRLLTSVFSGATLAGILARARADLLDRVRLLLDEELVRFVEVIDAAGPCDDVAAIRLYQAEFSLEAVR